MQDNSKGIGLKKAKVGVWTVFCMIFCMSAAGAYGIEDMISASGPGMTIVLLCVLPFFWSIPMGLTAAELGSAIPQEGGYYKWVQRGMGEFWGFQAGWWRTCSIYIDSTGYIVLAVGYITTMFPLTGIYEYLLKFAFILFFTFINLRGIKDVGRFSAIFSVIVFIAFLIITVMGFANWHYNPMLPFIPPGETVPTSIGLGLAIAMWMYAGYESMSTIAGEIEDPQIIPKATLLSVPAIMAVYIFPTIAGLAAIGQWNKWSTEAGGVNFADLTMLGGGIVLTAFFVFAAASSNLSLYNAYLASGSRGFFVLADDNLAPAFLKKCGKKHGTPYIAILSMTLFNMIFVTFTFSQLVVINTFFLSFSYILIYIANIKLRINEPDLVRPFKIPFGTKGIILMSIPPILLVAISVVTNGWGNFFAGMAGAISGPVAYIILKKMYGGIAAKPFDPKSIPLPQEQEAAS